MDRPEGGHSFVPLPIPLGEVLRVLGPRRKEAAVAVDPLVKLDEPLGVVQAFVAGVCEASGRLLQPLEVMLVVDPATVVPNRQVPAGAVVRMLNALPALQRSGAFVPAPGDCEALSALIAEPARVGPLLYCRKRQCIFAARSAGGARPLRAVPAGCFQAAGADGPDLPAELLSWDAEEEVQAGDGGPGEAQRPESAAAAATNRTPTIYGGRGGACAVGVVLPLEQLLPDQGKVVEFAAELEQRDVLAAERLAREHACVRCPERERCYPKGGGHAYATDRLVAVSAVEGPLLFRPLGEWRWAEASAIIGGLPATDALAGQERVDNDFEVWRAERAQSFDAAGPTRLLVGETDGRELVEIARLKLGLIAEVLERLDAVWRATGRPHLCWNRETVRVAWRRSAEVPGTCWGFQALLRKGGLQPAAPFETPDGRPLVYPPVFSDAALLPPEALAAARYFAEPRPATVFVKAVRAGYGGADVSVLLEEVGIPWELFCCGDALHAAGAGWRAVLAPAAQRDADDGAGLPFAGRATGEVGALNKGAQIGGVECRWYPRFGEAVDLHAVGMLLLESLLSNDERSVRLLDEQHAAQVDELMRACRGLPVEQRDGYVRSVLRERCAADAPAAVWSRRNLLYRREDRKATRLEGLAAELWREVITFALRLTTRIAGFSYCADRACAAPRVAGGLLLPLVELRGLMALLDDRLFGRAAPGAALRAMFG